MRPGRKFPWCQQGWAQLSQSPLPAENGWGVGLGPQGSARAQPGEQQSWGAEGNYCEGGAGRGWQGRLAFPREGDPGTSALRAGGEVRIFLLPKDLPLGYRTAVPGASGIAAILQLRHLPSTKMARAASDESRDQQPRPLDHAPRATWSRTAGGRAVAREP
jgi:hypothetical protein